MLKLTIDTNVRNRENLDRISEAVRRLDVEIAATTVTIREQGLQQTDEAVVCETGIWGESRWGESVWGPNPAVPETFVLDESRLGNAALGGAESRSRFQAILDVATNGSFPPPGKRNELSEPQRRQLRDAMILQAHARDKRDILISNDVTFFGRPGSVLRERLQRLCETRIVTVDEFCDFARALAQQTV